MNCHIDEVCRFCFFFKSFEIETDTFILHLQEGKIEVYGPCKERI